MPLQRIHAYQTTTPSTILTAHPPPRPSISTLPLHPHTHLPPQQLPQRTPIPQIHPLPPSLSRHPIITLRPRYRRREPDLFVGRLFVEDVGAGGGEEEG